MRGLVASGCLLTAVLVTPVVRAQAGGNVPCPPANPCPPAKVVVEMSPPEVVFRPAPAAAACCEKRGCLYHLFHCKHCCNAPAQQTQAMTFMASPQLTYAAVAAPAVFAAQPTAFAVQQVAAAPVSVMSVPQFAPATVQPTFFPASAPFVGGAPAMQMVATGPACTSSSTANAVAELAALRLKSQELESRATLAMTEALRESIATHQMALSALTATARTGGGGEGPSAAPAGTERRVSPEVQALKRRLQELLAKDPEVRRELEEMFAKPAGK